MNKLYPKLVNISKIEINQSFMVLFIKIILTKIKEQLIYLNFSSKLKKTLKKYVRNKLNINNFVVYFLQFLKDFDKDKTVVTLFKALKELNIFNYNY